MHKTVHHFEPHIILFISLHYLNVYMNSKQSYDFVFLFSKLGVTLVLNDISMNI